MYTSKEAIIDMIAAMGPQELPDLIRECIIQATDDPTRESVKHTVEQMVGAGELFTDGEAYSTDKDDV